MTQYKQQEERYKAITEIVESLKQSRKEERENKLKSLSVLLYRYLKEQNYLYLDKKLLLSFLDDSLNRETNRQLVLSILKNLLKDGLIKPSQREIKVLSFRRNLLTSEDDNYKAYGCKSVSGNKSILAYKRIELIKCYTII